MKVKQALENYEGANIKIHIDGEFYGTYSTKEVIEKYGECEGRMVEYEKEYDEGQIVVRRFFDIRTK